MEEVIALLVGLGVVGLGMALPEIAEQAKRLGAWRDARRLKELVRMGFQPASNDRWERVIEGRRVTIDPAPDGTFRLELRVHAKARPERGRQEARAEIARGRGERGPTLESNGLRIGLGPNEVPIGDPDFDAVVSARGERPEILALLSAELRATLVRGVGRGWRFEEDPVTSALSGARAGLFTLQLGWPGAVEGRVREGVELVQAFERATPPSVSEGLYRRVATDPVVAVRQAALTALILTFEPNLERPWLEPALKVARRDPAPELRLLAARRDGDLEALGALARAGPDPIRREALAVLVAEHSAAPAAHTVFIALLGERDEALTLTALDGLRRGGLVDAVQHLLPLRESASSAVLKAAARAAIDAIQARAGGSQGALSLATEHGELALAPEDG